MHTEELQAAVGRTAPLIGDCDYLELTQAATRPSTAERMLPPLLFSIAVHGAFAFLLLNVLPAEPLSVPAELASIRVRIAFPAAEPLAAAESDTATALEAPAPVMEAPPAVEAAAEPQIPSVAEPIETSSLNVRETVDVPVVAPAPPEQESIVAPIRPPPTFSIRQLVESGPDGNGSTMQCTGLQRENPLILCAETEAERTAERLPGLAAGASTLSGATLGIMLRQQGTLRERLRSEVPEYLDYQLDQILEGFMGAVDTPESRMTDLINLNNPAYQMIKSVTQPR